MLYSLGFLTLARDHSDEMKWTRYDCGSSIGQVMLKPISDFFKLEETKNSTKIFQCQLTVSHFADVSFRRHAISSTARRVDPMIDPPHPLKRTRRRHNTQNGDTQHNNLA